MKPIAITLLAVLGCGKSDSKDNPAAGQPAPAAPPAAVAPTPAPAPPPPPVADIDPCSLVSAAEVGAAIGKTVVSKKDGAHQCSYGLDPAEQQKAIDDLTKGGMAGIAGAAKGGGFKIPSAISNQLAITLEIANDAQTEAEIKQVFAGVGSAVNTAVAPNDHGLKDTITAGQELTGLGDWAFTTNIAAVTMPGGISERGRLLESRQGSWRLSLSVTIAPDPGAKKLDDEMVAIVTPALAKLKK
jgi:hypothetical protein